MNTPATRLTRRNATLPALDELDSNLRHAGKLHRLLTAVLPVLTLAAFGMAFGGAHYWALPLIILAHFIFTVAFMHDVAHGCADLGAGATRWALLVYGAVMLQSGHAFRYNHLFHHTHCLEDDDMEGAPANMPLWRVLLAGPAYVPRLWWRAVHAAAPRERRWMLADLSAIVLVLALASLHPAVLLYCAFVYLGSWAYPLTTGYLPHFMPGERPLEKARTVRGLIIPVLFMNLTYHLEHHLYPQVPSMNLARLAVLLDPLFEARGLHLTHGGNHVH